MSLLAVAFGGGLGAVLRYLATLWIDGLAGEAFPWATFAVNALGSLALGFALVWIHSTPWPEELRHFLAIGLLGSFTTFSTFSYETVELLQAGEWGRAGGYTAGSVAVGLVAVVAGAILATALTDGG